MEKIIDNIEKKQKNKREKKKEFVFSQSFRTDKESGGYLKLNVSKSNRSRFIREALHFYIAFLNTPVTVMIELKRRFPEFWRKVNRRKFL